MYGQSLGRILFFLEELCSMTPLVGVGLLHRVGLALGNESADLHYHLLGLSMCSA